MLLSRVVTPPPRILRIANQPISQQRSRHNRSLVRCCSRAPHSLSVVALDVEYIHFQCKVEEITLPGEVCVVDTQGNVLHHSYCNPGRSGAELYWCGGVRPKDWLRAPSILVVAARVALAIQGRLLVGHGLRKDLQSLGLSHPGRLIRDTTSFAPFQTRGHARKLKALALELLGRNIQVGRHRAREDATAALRLYLKFIDEVEPDPEALMQYHLSMLGPRQQV